MLSDTEFLRYSRQLMLPMCAEQGIHKLKQSRVVIVGAGGLGSIAAPYLAGAGVGCIRVYDDDLVTTSNLPRQWLYAGGEGHSKAILASQKLARINPACRASGHAVRLDSGNAIEALENTDLVLDCSDNMATRQAINARCFALGVPLISAAAIGTQAQCIALSPHNCHQHQYGCYHCLYPLAQDRAMGCNESGVLGPAVGVAASVQAGLAIQFLVREESMPWSALWRMDCANLKSEIFRIPQDPTCPVCSGCSSAAEARGEVT